MDQTLLDELRKIRNEVAHGGRQLDPELLGEKIREHGLSLAPGELQPLVAEFLRGSRDGQHYVPPVVLDVVRALLEGFPAKSACDPWAGLGVLAAVVQEALGGLATTAYAVDGRSMALGAAIAPQLDWRVGDLLHHLGDFEDGVDVVTSILPFGVRTARPTELRSEPGEFPAFRGDLGWALLAASVGHLSTEGLGIFVVSPNFFFDRRSVLHALPELGAGVVAALALPAGSFAPFTNMSAYLVVVRKSLSQEMFVAQLSQDAHTNRQLVANFRNGCVSGPVELGRLVAISDFRGMDALRLDERLLQAEQHFGGPPVRLGDLAEKICLGRSDSRFAFPSASNVLYIPLIGSSDVVDSIEEMKLKAQNYAQVVIDATHSDARFVARFLNSDLGRAIRDAGRSGITIPKLNTSGLMELSIFVPDLVTQKRIMVVATRVVAERNALLGLHNELEELHRALWEKPDQVEELDSTVQTFSNRLKATAGSHTSLTLEQWFETLPFPLASILRAWQAAPGGDYKTKYEHLLHFFEAHAEFSAVVFLSAFASRAEMFAEQKRGLKEAWEKQHLSLERSSFGTWRLAVEYFSKRTRALLEGDQEERTLCGELFSDPSLTLPRILANRESVAILSRANRMRNDWTGHGGVVSDAEAQLRNEQLLTEVQKLRETTADGWQDVQLIRAHNCQPRRGMFDNEIAILVGSNSEFLKQTRSMANWLDVERLYMISRVSGQTLPLLPLIQVGASPASVKNACYFFSRLERDGARFVSYHFADVPETKDLTGETSAVIHDLLEVSTW